MRNCVLNPYLEQACQWFGPASCETATVEQLLTMVFSVTLAIVGAIWLTVKLGSIVA